MAVFRSLITRLGLSVNEQKTRLAMLPEESFDVLGYTIGPFHGKSGRADIGTRPSKKSVGKLRARIREETSSHWSWQPPADGVEALNPILRGWCGYFNQGPVGKVYRPVRRAATPRVADAAGAVSRGRV